MATLAENEDGTGSSKVYIAQNFDLQIDSLPPELDFLSNEMSDQEVASMAKRVPLHFSERSYEFRATEGNRFSQSLKDRVTGGSGTLAFSRATGPVWLEVTPDGELNGRPEGADNGVNSFLFSVTDEDGHLDAVRLQIEVGRR